MFLPPKNDNLGETSLWSIKLYGVAICLGEVGWTAWRTGMMGRCSWDILCKRGIDKKKNFTRYTRNICPIFTYQLMIMYRQIVIFYS